MSRNNILPFPLGSVSTDADNADRVGSRYVVNNVEYIMVKSTGSISCAKLFIQWNDASAYTVDAVAGDAELRGAVAGLGRSDQVAIVSGDYFFVIRNGPGTATTETATVGAQVPFATYGTDGKIGDSKVSAATVIGTTTAAQATIDSDITVNVELG